MLLLFRGLKYVLLFLIALLAIILLAVALFIIFHQNSNTIVYANNEGNQIPQHLNIPIETELWTEEYQRNQVNGVTSVKPGNEELMETFHDVLFPNNWPKLESSFLQAEHIRTGHHPSYHLSTILTTSTSTPTKRMIERLPIHRQTYKWTYPMQSLSSLSTTTVSSTAPTLATQENKIVSNKLIFHIINL